jgi:perosamine synthetase
VNKKIGLITFRGNNTIKEVMGGIDKGSLRIAIIVDNEERLVGVATDGDIRRALLSGKKLNSPIHEVMHINPTIASEGTPATELLEMMLEKDILQIPVVDHKGNVIDIALFSELKTIPLSSPDITNKEVEIINEVLSTPFLSIGPKIKEFEDKLLDYIGTEYALAVNSGTSGLHLCIKSIGIKEGDEVITTPLSFIASSNCILFERGKPIFVDIEEDTLCIDVERIEEKITEKTKAILPVHLFGHPCKMDKIMEIAEEYNLLVIEDACEALGSEYMGKKVGSFGKAAVFAFYPNKQITTAEGGMIVTNDRSIAKLCMSLRNQGKEDDSSTEFRYGRLGYNYRMSELSAALGVAQIERIDEILRKRQKVSSLYGKQLGKIDGIKIPYVAPNVKMSWFVYVIILESMKYSGRERNRIIQELNEKGIASRVYFPSIHLQPFYVEMFGYKKGSFPITEKISDLTIALPFYNNLSEEDIDFICGNLEKIIGNL